MIQVKLTNGRETAIVFYEMEIPQAMEQALKNSEQDYQNVITELEEVNSRFDEARAEAKREGKAEMAQQMKAEMRSDSEHEIKQMKEQLEMPPVIPLK